MKFEKKSAEVKTKDELDEKFALFMFACKEPFMIVENIHFRNFVHALNSSYAIPSRKTISKSLLDKCYENLVKEERCETRQRATMLVDGWKNKSTDAKYVVAMAKIRDSGKELLVRSYDLSDVKIDAEKILEVTVDATEVGENLFNLKIDSVISDNDSTMRKAGKDSMLIDYGCLAHQGNLFVGDIYDSKLYSSVHNVMVEFKSNTKLQSNVQKLGGHKLYTRGLTR